VRDAARVIGDAELFKKMEEAQNKIRRDSECKPSIKDRSSVTGCYLSCICGKFVFLGRAKGGEEDIEWSDGCVLEFQKAGVR